MTEQPAAGAVGQRDAPEAAPADVGDPVVPREPLVDEREVGVDQIQDAAILADDGLEQQFRLAPEGVAEVAVELLRCRRHVVELPQLQPLSGQIVDERRGRGIRQHAPRLLLEHRGIGEPALCRQPQQLLVRDAAPEEEGQPRRQLEIADPVDRAGAQARRRPLEPVDELRIDEHAREGVLDPGLETAKRAARLVEPEQRRRSSGRSRSPAVAARAWRARTGSAARTATSSAGVAGRQLKILRRLGVSPGPVGFSGPLIARLCTPALLASSENRSSTPRALARRTTATPIVCGPAGILSRMPPRGAFRPSSCTRSPFSVISTSSSTPTGGSPNNPPPARPTLNSYSASSGNTCCTSRPPRVPSGSPSRCSACDNPRGGR